MEPLDLHQTAGRGVYACDTAGIFHRRSLSPPSRFLRHLEEAHTLRPRSLTGPRSNRTPFRRIGSLVPRSVRFAGLVVRAVSPAPEARRALKAPRARRARKAPKAHRARQDRRGRRVPET